MSPLRDQQLTLSSAKFLPSGSSLKAWLAPVRYHQQLLPLFHQMSFRVAVLLPG